MFTLETVTYLSDSHRNNNIGIKDVWEELESFFCMIYENEKIFKYQCLLCVMISDMCILK